MRRDDEVTVAARVAAVLRPALEGVAAYEPGRPIDDVRRELGIDSVVKLASNEGPHPPMPAAIQAIRDAAEGIRVYPDPGAWALRDALSAATGVPSAGILAGAGIDGLIPLVCGAVLDPGDELAMGWPSFMSWRQQAVLRGAVVKTAPLRADGGYDLDALLAQVGPRTKLVVVVSPNNPTGQAVARGELEAFLDALPGHVLPVLDEAYFEYLGPDDHDGAAMVAAGRPLVVTRTFSKAYGLAGLRVGYLFAPAEFVTALGKVRSVFDVSATAQAAAVASLADAPAHLPERVGLILQQRDLVAEGLRALGFDPLPSRANFLTFDTSSPEQAAALNQDLLSGGVIVRPLGAFGAPASIRVTVGWPAENERFLATLEQVSAG
ncbi:MAG: histidinol-phosphate transaminase [Miltoncostaeaceae bacterium]